MVFSRPVFLSFKSKSKKMAVTILGALQNANYNLKTSARFPPVLAVASGQLNNAVVLLEKGYPLKTEVEPLLEEFGDVENVPEYPDDESPS